MESNVIDFNAAKRAKKAAQRKLRRAIAPHRGPGFGWQVLMAPQGLSITQMTRRDAVRLHASETL